MRPKARHELMNRASLALRNIENCLEHIASANIHAVCDAWQHALLTESLEELSRKASAIEVRRRMIMADLATDNTTREQSK